MKRGRGLVGIGVVAFALAGCRAVLGIDPLELVDGGEDASVDASVIGDASDGGAEDAKAEAEAAVLFPDASASIAACVSQGPQGCRGCCRETFTSESNVLETYAIDDQCICGTGQCAASAQCGDLSCAIPRKGPTQPCGPCEDQAFTSGSAPCMKANNECKADPKCAAASDCINACPK